MADTKYGRCQVGQCDAGMDVQLLTWDRSSHGKGKYKCSNCLAYINSQREAAASHQAVDDVAGSKDVSSLQEILEKFLPFVGGHMEEVITDAYNLGHREGFLKGKGKGLDPPSRSRSRRGRERRMGSR